MIRARLTRVGWDDDLVIEAAPRRAIRDGEIAIAVEACGVCHRDCIDRSGRFLFIQPPITPGHEAVGRVTEVGANVTQWSVGDRVATMHRDYCGACDACAAGEVSLCTGAAAVLGLLIDGGYASELVVPDRAVFAVPEGVDAAAAACMHCTFGTAFRALTRRGPDLNGRRVLVTGANGGVGSAAIQLAKTMGATEVAATVRDEAAVPYVEGLGADVVVVDADGRFHKQLEPRFDIAVECVGQPTFNAALRSVQVGGWVVAVGNIVPERVELNLGFIITRGVTVCGAGGATPTDMARVFELWAQGGLRLQTTTMPLSKADEAQRTVRAGGLRGRIVLAME